MTRGEWGGLFRIKGIRFTGKTTNILLAVWSDLPKNGASNLKTKDSS